MSKLTLKRYGDRLSMEHKVSDGVSDLMKAFAEDPGNTIEQ